MVLALPILLSNCWAGMLCTVLNWQGVRAWVYSTVVDRS